MRLPRDHQKQGVFCQWNHCSFSAKAAGEGLCSEPLKVNLICIFMNYYDVTSLELVTNLHYFNFTLVRQYTLQSR